MIPPGYTGYKSSAFMNYTVEVWNGERWLPAEQGGQAKRFATIPDAQAQERVEQSKGYLTCIVEWPIINAKNHHQDAA